MDLKKIIWKLLWTCIELDVWVGTLVLKWAGAIPMPAWCSTSDGQAAKGEIEREMKTRGWDLLSRASSKDQLDIGLDQRRKFITHLQCQYPDAQKDTAAWQKFISKLTGQAKQWKSASTAYTQASNQTHNPTKNLALSDSRLKRKAGAGLSRHDCVCCRVNWRGFCTASACCVEDGVMGLHVTVIYFTSCLSKTLDSGFWTNKMWNIWPWHVTPCHRGERLMNLLIDQ